MVETESTDCKINLVVIQGPTASGKSDFAVRLAEVIQGEIVNADSMQVYRYMDIGTAKPSPIMMEKIPHHLIDIVAPDEDFTAADFSDHALRAIEQINRKNSRTIVVGGTGLYIRALLHGLVPSPRYNSSVRDKLKNRAASEGNAVLLNELNDVDSLTASKLHPNDQVRIIRALEVFLQTGVPISSYRQEHGFRENKFRVLKIGISVPREELYRRIELRVDEMFKAGLVDEVRSLLTSGYSPDLKPFRSIGYKEVCAFLMGRSQLAETVNLVKQNTRRYAKRQLTWFKKDTEIKWVEYPDSFATICNHVIDFFAKGEENGKSTL